MAARVVVDAGFVVALLSRRDRHHRWATAQAGSLPPPWSSCEAVVSEAFHLIGSAGQGALAEFLRRCPISLDFSLANELEPVLKLMRKYASVPMSLADGCIVRMTETFADPIVLTTDGDFRIYRRHSRQVVPSILP